MKNCLAVPTKAEYIYLWPSSSMWTYTVFTKWHVHICIAAQFLKIQSRNEIKQPLIVKQIICDTVILYVNENQPMTSIHNMDEIYNIRTQPQNQCILDYGNKWRPNENRERPIIQNLLIARESATVTWVLAETKAGRGAEKINSRKRKGCRCALIGGSWHGKALSRLTRKMSSVIG